MRLKSIGGAFSRNPFVSIIVPFHWGLKKENYNRFVEDLTNYLKLDYKNYEIILVSDKVVDALISSKKIIYLTTKSKKPTSPAEKRDFALPYVKGEICAFIDDDAYPDKKWLKKAVRWFINPDIIAIGGPGVTPSEDSFWQKIGGYILESYFGSGDIKHRFYPDGKFLVKDQPAYNFFVRTDVLKKVGGWGSTLYGGEDTLLCIKLLQKGNILYDEKVVVYHHRRSFPIAHFKQVASVGWHRGYFFKKYPETSRNILYLLPTMLTLGLLVGVFLSIQKPELFLLPFLSLLFIAFLLGWLSVMRRGAHVVSATIASFGIILTHIAYGTFFVKGLFTRKLLR